MLKKKRELSDFDIDWQAWAAPDGFVWITHNVLGAYMNGQFKIKWWQAEELGRELLELSQQAKCALEHYERAQKCIKKGKD